MAKEKHQGLDRDSGFRRLGERFIASAGSSEHAASKVIPNQIMDALIAWGISNSSRVEEHKTTPKLWIQKIRKMASGRLATCGS
ncbi:MAG: hypothetical protein Q9186_000788 [Xanthomendoza sp. 1 TL-2023]